MLLANQFVMITRVFKEAALSVDAELSIIENFELAGRREERRLDYRTSVICIREAGA